MKMNVFSNIGFYYELNFRILLFFFLSFSWVIFFKKFYVQELRPFFLVFCYHYICRVVGETTACKITASCLHFTTCTNTPCFLFEPRFELQSEATDVTVRDKDLVKT